MRSQGKLRSLTESEPKPAVPPSRSVRYELRARLSSTGAALALSEVFTQATPVLPWNIYNICSEHEMAERVAHVQYGMVLTLISIVLLLNGVAIWVRARMRSKMKS